MMVRQRIQTLPAYNSEPEIAMFPVYSKLFSIKTILATGITIVAISFMFLCTEAEGSWWQKGQDLLQGFGKNSSRNELTSGEISAGLKEALRVGTETVVSRLSKFDGFNGDAVIHIPLPDKLKSVKSALHRIGLSGPLDDLEIKLNRAAEAATPKAKELFRQAITEMTISDVEAIYRGPEDSATRYFRSKMSPALAEQMKPVVDTALAEVGAIQAYDSVMEKYHSIPFVPDVKADLSAYVIEKGMDGIFYYLAKEEADIRKNPVKQTTELLRRVFGR
jgi:hypothetical protein